MPMQISGVSELIYAVGGAPAQVKAALKPAVLEAGNIVGDQVKANASFSSWIPGAVKVSSSFGISNAGAKITVAERGYPHRGEVGVFEGNGVSPSPFMAPVYGGPGHHPMMTHPFAHPALEAKRDEATEVIATAVKTVIESIGL